MSGARFDDSTLRCFLQGGSLFRMKPSGEILGEKRCIRRSTYRKAYIVERVPGF